MSPSQVLVPVLFGALLGHFSLLLQAATMGAVVKGWRMDLEDRFSGRTPMETIGNSWPNFFLVLAWDHRGLPQLPPTPLLL